MEEFKKAIKAFVECCMVQSHFNDREPNFADVSDKIASKISKSEIEAFQKKKENIEANGGSHGYEHLTLKYHHRVQIERSKN